MFFKVGEDFFDRPFDHHTTDHPETLSAWVCFFQRLYDHPKDLYAECYF
jgi:hypothetical protein